MSRIVAAQHGHVVELSRAAVHALGGSIFRRVGVDDLLRQRPLLRILSHEGRDDPRPHNQRDDQPKCRMDCSWR